MLKTSLGGQKVHQLTVANVPVVYADEGSGPPVLLAHCSSGNHRMWKTLIRDLAPRRRVLAPDLIGYGQSGRWPEGRPYEPDADVQLIRRLANLAGEPVHMVGHSYGAAMALEAARMLGPDKVRGMTLIEPVSFHLLGAGGYEAELQTVREVARRTNAAIAAGDRRAASAAYMGFWLGRFRWWLAPKKLKAPVMETVDKVAMEFAAIDQQSTGDLTPYRAIRAPTLLLYGEKTRAPAKAVVRLLSETLPLARSAAIPGAGHMSPFTHREKVNALIVKHIREVEDAPHDRSSAV
jgi:pimeloyl-ACP methyl ester carboxylesterase